MMRAGCWSDAAAIESAAVHRRTPTAARSPCSLRRVVSLVLAAGFTSALSLSAAAPAPVSAPGQPAVPWREPMHRLTWEEYEATLRYWASEYPGLVQVQKRGQSHDGYGVYALRLTDVSVPDEDKQVAVVTALHGGPERSGVTTALTLVDWLLAGSPEAAECLRRQVIVVMPIPNPHAFFVSDRFGNKLGIDVYDPPAKWWKLPELQLVDPEKTPEIAAVVSVMDEYQPEVHIDLHGTGLQAYPPALLEKDRNMYKGRTRFEITACSYSNCTVRPWDPRITEAMVRAGQVAGFGSDRAEADAERLFWSADNDALKDRLWTPARPAKFRTPFYAYMKYHTMPSVTEIGWEQSGLARVRGLLEIGNGTWVDERTRGYPVNRVKARGSRYVTAYGATAAERRRSRAELWQAQGGYSDGILYPEYEGRATYVCAVTPRGVAALDPDLRKFAANLNNLPNVDAGSVERFISAGPEFVLTGDRKAPGSAAPVRHGIGFRLRIPYRSPEILEVAVNGSALSESDSDGYRAWLADGFTQVQVNVPPEKAAVADLFVVTCTYRGNETRNYGWTPPAAVLESLGREVP